MPPWKKPRPITDCENSAAGLLPTMSGADHRSACTAGCRVSDPFTSQNFSRFKISNKGINEKVHSSASATGTCGASAVDHSKISPQISQRWRRLVGNSFSPRSQVKHNLQSFSSSSNSLLPNYKPRMMMKTQMQRSAAISRRSAVRVCATGAPPPPPPAAVPVVVSPRDIRKTDRVDIKCRR